MIAALVWTAAPLTLWAQDRRAGSITSDDAGGDNESQPNSLRQSIDASAQPFVPSDLPQMPSYQHLPTTGNVQRNNGSMAWLPYRPDDASSSTPYSAAPSNQSIMRPGLKQPPTMPPAAFSPLPTSAPPGGLQSLPMQSGEMLHGVPSQAASYPSSAGVSGNYDNCQSCDPSMYGNSQNRQQPNSQTPWQFQPEHYPRALGPGEPLVGTSWQNRPFYLEGFAGTMIGDDAIRGAIGQESGFFTGVRLGMDYDYYWGVESRLGIAWMTLFDKRNAFINLGNGDIVVWDMSLLYYPWGDSRWRPFLQVGVGISQFDTFGGGALGYTGTLFEIPFGVGIKYHFNEWLAWRFEVIDNLAMSDGTLDTMNNVSFTGGLEYHFGGHPRNYWPWNPDPKH